MTQCACNHKIVRCFNVFASLGEDKTMTQLRRGLPRKRSRVSARQAELPLSHKKSRNDADKSKLIFQIKSELRRLQSRDREWKLMFQMLSHDLKEPIVTLEGFTKLLDESELTKDQQRYVKVVREAVSTLHRLVGSLQSLSRLSHDSQDFSEFSLNELLSSVITSLSQQIQRTKGSIDLPSADTIITGDPIRLFQIFLNLIANSLKYHKKAEPPHIQISYRKTAGEHRISFRDNGVGISPTDLDRIFLPFTRLKDIPTDGLGIGLTIVKRIAESFKGRVLVKSKQGVGTTFTICLPKEYGTRGTGGSDL